MGKNSIIFCGPASSGKTTAAKHIAKKFKLKFYDGGDVLKLFAKDLGFKPSKKGWWDTKEGMEFFQLRKNDPSFDKKVDDKFKKILDKGNCVITSWSMPWVYKGDSIRIWISALLEERAERMSKRDKISLDEAKNIAKQRDKINNEYFKKLYGIRFGLDYTPFDIVLDTSHISEKDVANILAKELKGKIKKVSKRR